jgi:hypothetical protein
MKREGGRETRERRHGWGRGVKGVGSICASKTLLVYLLSEKKL